jgi:hypothetical protein
MRMKNLLGTIGFFVVASVVFRVFYGAWPPSSGSFLPWLASDSRAQWSLMASLVAGAMGSAILRALASSPPNRPERVAQADAYGREALARHEARQIPEAIDLFTRAIILYEEAGRATAAAPWYASLGKLYFDVNELDRAEQNLTRALAAYRSWPEAREAIAATTALLHLIAERRQNLDAPRAYRDSLCSFDIPPNWANQERQPAFVHGGGRIAISHRSHAATFNLSVGPLEKPEWLLPEVRAVAVKTFLWKAPHRIGDIEVSTFVPVDGETNVVVGEYDTRRVGPTERQRRNGFLSIVHGGLEFALQWSAESDYEAETRRIVASFRFALGDGATTV